MILSFISIGYSPTTRESRLLGQVTPFDPDRSPINRLTDRAEGFIKGQTDRVLRPEIGRTKRQLDDQAQVARFLRPDAFSNPQQLDQFMAMLERRVPPDVRAQHPDLFGTPLTAEDVEELRSTGGGRVATLQRVLSLIAGSNLPTDADPLASEIARASIDSREDAPDRNSQIFGLYRRYMQSHRPPLNEIDATSADNIVGDPLAPPELVAAIRLGNVDQQSLTEMYDIYRRRGTDTDLTMLEQRQQFGRMFGSVDEREYRQRTSSVMENFRDADPRLQYLVMGVGAFMLWKGLRSENGYVRAASIGLVGWWAYDRFVNGNENAIDNMGNKFKTATSFAGSRVRDAAQYVGLVGPRQERDRLATMSRFLDQHRLDVGPAAAGMASLAQVNLGTIADAFVPISGGVALGGALSIDGGSTRGSGDSFRDVEAGGGSPGARRLYRELNDQATRMGLSRSEKEAMFEYQMTHREAIGKAVAHSFYLIAGKETENAATVREIDEEMVSLNSFDDLPMHLKEKYNRMVIQGQRIAKLRHPNRTFADIITTLAPAEPSRRRRPQETSTLNPDPETPDRREEFGLYRQLRQTPFDAGSRDALLQRGSEIELDYSEFIDNCENARIISGDAKLALKRKFDDLLNEGSRGRESLPQVLMTVEKIKYAVLVASARSNEPLTPDMILSMTGPNSSTVMAVFNTVTRFLNQGPVGVPGSFHNISTLNHIDALLNRPFFGMIGGGPLRSMDGNRFTALRSRITNYQRQMSERRNIDRMVEQTLDRLSTSDPGLFERFSPGNPTEGRSKARETMLAALRHPRYAERLARTEQYVSQRMANSLVRRMLVVEGPEGLARAQSRGERVISDNEQANIAADWDRMFNEIVGEPDDGATGAWHRVEDLETTFGNALNVDTLNYADATERRNAVNYAQELALSFTLMIVPGRMRPDIRDAIRAKTETMRTRMEAQRNNEMATAVGSVEKRLSEFYTRHGTNTSGATLTVSGPILAFLQRTAPRLLPLRATLSTAGNNEIATFLEGGGNELTALENQYAPQMNQLTNILVLLGANVPLDTVNEGRIGGGTPVTSGGLPPPLTTTTGGLPPPLTTTTGGLPPPLTTTSGGLPPPLTTGGLPPPLTSGGLPPSLSGGGLPPPLTTGGLPPSLSGGLPPPLSGGGLPPPLGVGGAPPALSPEIIESNKITEIFAAEIAPGLSGLRVRRQPVATTLPAVGYEIIFPNRARSEYASQLTPAQFNSLSVPQIVQRWKQDSETTLKTLLNAFSDPRTPDGFLAPWTSVTLGAGDIVSYTSHQLVDGVAQTAQTPLHILIQHNPEEIASTYNVWANSETNRKAFRDPYAVPNRIQPGVLRGLPGPATP